MTRLENIKEQLKDLTADELEQVAQHVQLLRTVSGKPGAMPRPSVTSTDAHDYLLDAICTTCRDLGIDMRDLHAARHSPRYSQFRARAPILAGFLRSFCTTRVQQQAIVRIALSHWHEEGRNVMGKMNLHIVMSNPDRIAEAIDVAFPGYVQAGLMKVVVNSLKVKRNA